MILPKSSLLARAARGFGAQFGLPVHPAQREVSIGQADAALVFSKQGLQCGLNFSAEGTLKIRELDNDNRRLRASAEPRGVIGDFHFGSSHGRCLRVLAEIFQVLLARLRELGLLGCEFLAHSL